jgi:hypothetical protein
MSTNLTDGQIAVLAEQAASYVPGKVAVRIAPAASDDPYRWEKASWTWTVFFDLGERERVPVRVDSRGTPAGALAQMLGQLSQAGSQTRALRGQPVPACPGHTHPALVEEDDEVVTLRCPQTREVVQQIRPDLPG